MFSTMNRWTLFLAVAWSCLGSRERLASKETDRFVVATYNVENYLLTPTETRTAKSPLARARVRDSVLAIQPDILALQEIGETNALFELQAELAKGGLSLPYWEHVRGHDTNIFVAVLSRFPVVDRRSHSNVAFLLNGRRFRSGRGIVDIDIQVNPQYRLTLLATHLKSKRLSAEADEAEIRYQESIKFREVIDRALNRSPRGNVLVCGDFNDSKDSRTIQTVIGSRLNALIDARPAEKNGDKAAAENPRFEPRRVVWTHYFGREDTYSRVDYILMNRGLAREWQAQDSFVLAFPDWGVASDHRPVVATFLNRDQ